MSCLLVRWGRDLERLEEPAGFLSLVKAQTGEPDGASVPPAFDQKPSHKAQVFMFKPPYILKPKKGNKIQRINRACSPNGKYFIYMIFVGF